MSSVHDCYYYHYFFSDILCVIYVHGIDYRTKDDCFVQYNTKRYACLCTVDKHHAEQQSYTGESPALRHLVVG